MNIEGERKEDQHVLAAINHKCVASGLRRSVHGSRRVFGKRVANGSAQTRFPTQKRNDGKSFTYSQLANVAAADVEPGATVASLIAAMEDSGRVMAASPFFEGTKGDLLPYISFKLGLCFGFR